MKPLASFGFGLSALVITTKCTVAADVNVIHGIDGRDPGLAQELPVAISVNGACALKGVTFKQSAKVQLGAGDYNVKVFVATGICAGTPVIERNTYL